MNHNPPLSKTGYVDVFPFVKTGSGLEYLLLRRAADEFYPGIWQGVAGGIAQDETAVETAFRELREETGNKPISLYSLDHVSTYYLHRSNEILNVPTFAAELENKDIILSEEHDRFEWLDLEAACGKASWKPYREALKAIPRLLHNPAALALARIDDQ